MAPVCVRSLSGVLPAPAVRFTCPGLALTLFAIDRLPVAATVTAVPLNAPLEARSPVLATFNMPLKAVACAFVVLPAFVFDSQMSPALEFAFRLEVAVRIGAPLAPTAVAPSV